VARASLLSANLLTANAEGGVRASVPAARFRQGRCPDSVLLSARLLTANAEAGVKLQAGELSRFGFLSALLLTLNVEAGVSSAMLLLPLTLPRYSKTGDVAMVSLLSANLHTANAEGRARAYVLSETLLASLVECQHFCLQQMLRLGLGLFFLVNGAVLG